MFASVINRPREKLRGIYCLQVLYQTLLGSVHQHLGDIERNSLFGSVKPNVREGERQSLFGSVSKNLKDVKRHCLEVLIQT